MENNVLIVNEENISKKIYTIRGQKVMIDSEISATKCHNYTL